MNYRWTMALAGVYGALVVALGAVLAHGLKAHPQLESLRTGQQYVQLHALALLALSAWLFVRPGSRLRWAAAGMALGVVLFSGSIFLAALADKGWAKLAPSGGTLLIVSWLAMPALLWLDERNKTTTKKTGA